ncbi:MAG TPA: hypothetical protein VK745_26275 [Polyangiaceae bacterium]|jgi:hypothetical protein|nr:hypothetical protein [Polyangiaceae bacterium]
MVGTLVGVSLGKGLYRATARRFPAFATGFLNAFDPDPSAAGAKAAQMAEERKDDHTYHDTVLRSFRQMMEAVDESVVPTLGYMAGQYARANKRPDAIFRGLGRLLCDLEEGELEQLKSMLRLAATAFREQPEIGLILDRKGQLVASAREEVFYERKVIPDAQRLFMLMKRDGLGGNIRTDGAVAGAQARMPDRELSLDAITASRVREIVDPSDGSSVPQSRV